MDLADLKLMRTHVSNNVVILNELLKRPMLGSGFV